jgi:polysaccharide export outer membrane protein
MHRQTRQDSKSGASGASAWLALALCALLITACGALPSGGPKLATLNEEAEWKYTTPESAEGLPDALPFVLVDADPRVLETLVESRDASYFVGQFSDRSPPTDVAFGVGDTVRVTIFEAGAGGLFIPTSGTSHGGNFVTLPDQEVDQTGNISVPYAGKDGGPGLIKVHGMRAAEVQADIQQRLLNKAIEPQVIVSLVKRTSNQYSVMGDVHAPGRFGLEQSGVRILDALSAAGGPRNNDYNTLITLQRGESSATARLSTLLRDTQNNIFVQPNDLLAVKKDERFYNVLGATKSNSRMAFEAENVTLADALARSGGLEDQKAEPQGVVVFRRESQDTLKKLELAFGEPAADAAVPTVYRFDLSQPSGMFLAQKMPIHHNDVIYVAYHPFNDVSRIVSAFRDVLIFSLIND